MSEVKTLGVDDYCVHHFSPKLYAKEYSLKAGQPLIQHRHADDHLSILASGTVRLHVDGETTELTGPVCLNIAAHKHHGVHAITDSVWFCVHAVSAEAQTEEHDREQAQSVADAMGMGVLP